MAKKKKKNAIDCRIKYEVSKAGHLLRTRGFSSAGTILATIGKEQKAKRKKRGCLNGPPGTFQLTAKQKKNLPKALQKAILKHHYQLGKEVYE